jgi:hypothetical protein
MARPTVLSGKAHQEDKKVSGHELQVVLDSKRGWLARWLTASRNVTLTQT